jgi:transposase
MLNAQQRAQLDCWSRTHPRPGMRLKALAIRAVALGHTRQQVGAILHVSPYTVGQWCRAYAQAGWPALEIHPGRGRHSRVDRRQVEEYLRQSPRNFGIPRTRWTLRLLAQTVPCLAGLKISAVWAVLRRCGLSYKRAEPWLHSPDPEYAKKNATLKTSSSKRGSSRKP